VVIIFSLAFNPILVDLIAVAFCAINSVVIGLVAIKFNAKHSKIIAKGV